MCAYGTPRMKHQAPGTVCSRETLSRLVTMPRKSFAATILNLGISLGLGFWNLELLAADKGRVDFNRDIRPIFSETCFKCHGPDPGKRKAELRMDVRADATAKHEHGIPIVPGKSAQSEAFKRVISSDPEEHMPPPKSGKVLTTR